MKMYTLSEAPECSRGMALLEAHGIINGERQDAYGTPEDNFALIADFWSAYMGVPFTAHNVAIMMALMKIARIATGTGTRDSFIDAAGYIGLASDIKQTKSRPKGTAEGD